jgi:hypothetical protein
LGGSSDEGVVPAVRSSAFTQSQPHKGFFLVLGEPHSPWTFLPGNSQATQWANFLDILDESQDACRSCRFPYNRAVHDTTYKAFSDSNYLSLEITRISSTPRPTYRMLFSGAATRLRNSYRPIEINVLVDRDDHYVRCSNATNLRNETLCTGAHLDQFCVRRPSHEDPLGTLRLNPRGIASAVSPACPLQPDVKCGTVSIL